MPLQFNRTEDNGVIINGTGEVSAYELAGINQQIYDELKAIDWIQYQIVDLSAVTYAQVTIEELQDIAEQDVVAANQNPSMIIAVVCPKILYVSLAKVWQSFVQISGLETRIFEEREEADEWIREKKSLA